MHTGDVIQSYTYKNLAHEQETLAQLFKTLHPKYGIYNVIGDTDWRINPKQFDQQAGIHTLIDTEYLIHGEGVNFNILGLSLNSSRRGNRARIERWLQKSSPTDFNILFGHAPDYILGITDLDIDLCLAGHTHGGQIRVPFFGPIMILSQIPKDWAMGYRRINNIHFNVSAGIGAEHASQLPSIRVNCPPSMTLFTIRSSK